MAKENITKQKVAQLVHLFNQIKGLGFGSATLMVHDVPVLGLGKEWEIEKQEGSSYGGGKYTYFTATLPNKDGVPEINLFSRNENK